MAGGRSVKCTRCDWSKNRCFGKGVLVEPCPACGAKVWFADLWAGEKAFRRTEDDAHSELEPITLPVSTAFGAVYNARNDVGAYDHSNGAQTDERTAGTMAGKESSGDRAARRVAGRKMDSARGRWQAPSLLL
jgi:hypothetical protein